MLTDIDKSSPGRDKPEPNSHDVLLHTSVQAKGTNSVNYITPATNQSILAAGRNGQFTVVATGSFTADNFDSVTAPAGTFATGTHIMGTFPHNLPYIPGVLAYYGQTTGVFTFYQPLPFLILDNNPFAEYGVWTTFRVATDATNVYFYADTIAGGPNSTNRAGSGYGGFSFVYYLTQQTAN